MAAVNDVFGGPIKIHYWNFPISRGNNVRLVCSDLGVPYINVDLLFGENWPTDKARLLQEKINLGTCPYVTLPDGRVIGEHVAAIRYIARKVDKKYYPVEEEDKMVLVDEMLDLNQDWRLNRRVPPYKESRNQILDVIESRYNNAFHGSGPYLLGTQPTIADHFTFQTLIEYPAAIFPGEESRYPELVKLVEAMKERPGIKALLEKQEPQQEMLREMYGKVLPHLGEMLEEHNKGRK